MPVAAISSFLFQPHIAAASTNLILCPRHLCCCHRCLSHRRRFAVTVQALLPQLFPPCCHLRQSNPTPAASLSMLPSPCPSPPFFRHCSTLIVSLPPPSIEACTAAVSIDVADAFPVAVLASLPPLLPLHFCCHQANPAPPSPLSLSPPPCLSPPFCHHCSTLITSPPPPPSKPRAATVDVAVAASLPVTAVSPSPFQPCC